MKFKAAAKVPAQLRLLQAMLQDALDKYKAFQMHVCAVEIVFPFMPLGFDLDMRNGPRIGQQLLHVNPVIVIPEKGHRTQTSWPRTLGFAAWGCVRRMWCPKLRSWAWAPCRDIVRLLDLVLGCLSECRVQWRWCCFQNLSWRCSLRRVCQKSMKAELDIWLLGQ